VPPRARGVPLDAIWAGGPDGGVWIVAQKIAGSEDHYACKIFFDSTGDLWADGDYVLRRTVWDSKLREARFYPVASPPEKIDFGGFNGELLFLQDSLVLAPVHLRHVMNEANPTPRPRIEEDLTKR
jgi:hypothetical protein